MRTKPRIGSAKKTGGRNSQTPQSGVTPVWPPATPWPANRSPTPLSPTPGMAGASSPSGDMPNNIVDSPKKIQRPKTVSMQA